MVQDGTCRVRILLEDLSPLMADSLDTFFRLRSVQWVDARRQAWEPLRPSSHHTMLKIIHTDH